VLHASPSVQVLPSDFARRQPGARLVIFLDPGLSSRSKYLNTSSQMDSIMNALSKQSGAFYKLLIAGVVLTGIGGWMIAQSSKVTEQETVSLERLEKGTRPESRWVKASGKLLWNRAVEESRHRGGIGNVYVPFVSRRWQPGDKVAAFVKVSTLVEDKFGNSGTISGTTGLTGMSGQVRALFKRELGVESADIHIVIDEGSTPQSEARFGRICIVIGVVMLGICVVMLIVCGSESSEGGVKEGVYTKKRLAELHTQTDPQGENNCDEAVQEWMKQRGFQTTDT
jgi:hypothetical protein